MIVDDFEKYLEEIEDGVIKEAKDEWYNRNGDVSWRISSELDSRISKLIELYK